MEETNEDVLARLVERQGQKIESLSRSNKELLEAAGRVVGLVAAGVAQRGRSAPMTLTTPAIARLAELVARGEGRRI